MITIADIYKALKLRLEDCFEDLNIQVKDVKNISLPCFNIEYISGNKQEIANETTQTKYSFNIVYFSEEKTLIDLTSIEEKLKTALKKPLKVFYNLINDNVKSCYKFLEAINTNIDFDENDYILTFAINFDFIEPIEIQENNEKTDSNANPYDDEALNNVEKINDITQNFK